MRSMNLMEAEQMRDANIKIKNGKLMNSEILLKVPKLNLHCIENLPSPPAMLRLAGQALFSQEGDSSPLPRGGKRGFLTNFRRAGGFTLLEIIVVVFILSLLAAIVAPRIIGRTDDARIAEAKVQIR